MRTLLTILLLHMTPVIATELAYPVWPVQADTPVKPPAPKTTVATTSWPNPHRITLLTETCGWPGGAMRAQWIQRNNTIEWGCWGYNQTGVHVQWSTGQHMYIDYFELFYFDERDWTQQLGYNRLHNRLAQLKGTK